MRRPLTALAQLLIVVETVSGYSSAYLLAADLPPVREMVGLLLVAAGAGDVSQLPTSRPTPSGVLVSTQRG